MEGTKNSYRIKKLIKTGTGLALLVAMTIVVYRYYVVRQKGREWAELDRWEEEKIARKIKYRVSNSTVLN